MSNACTQRQLPGWGWLCSGDTELHIGRYHGLIILTLHIENPWVLSILHHIMKPSKMWWNQINVKYVTGVPMWCDIIFTPVCKAGPNDDKLSQVIFLDSNSAIYFLPLQIIYCIFIYLSYCISIYFEHCVLALIFIPDSGNLVDSSAVVYKWQMSQFPSTQSFIDFFVFQSVWLYGCWGHGTRYNKKKEKQMSKTRRFDYEKHKTKGMMKINHYS